MTAQWSLVLYTLLTQWAAGLAVFTAWKTRRALRAGERPSGPAWAPVTAAAALGLDGVWLSMPASELVVAVFCLILYVWGKNKRRR